MGYVNPGGGYTRQPITIDNDSGMSVPTDSTTNYQSITTKDAFGQYKPSSKLERYPIDNKSPDKIQPLPLRNLQFEDNQPYAPYNQDSLTPGVPYEERSYTNINPRTGSTLNTPPNISKQSIPQTSIDTMEAANSSADVQGNNNMTLGDYLQFAEVGSKFFQTLRGPEVENQILDNTRITKNNYDVRPQLLQSQRSFQNQLNSIDSPSLNLRRSLANNLYASKLNADAGVISQYDNMNKQANTQYEQQLSGQRRYNIQSTQQTNNLNAANRGAYDSVVQNAYTSLGNLGESLNNRKTGQDSLKILAQRYPDVYKGLVEELFNKKKP